MKILLMGLGKLKFMPYMNFYLDNLDKDKHDIHLLCWNRDLKPDTTENAEGITIHEYSCYQEDDVPKADKIKSFAGYRKYALELLKKSSLTVLSACGSSCFATQKFAHALCCIELPAKYIPPSEAVHGGMGALKKGNLLILVSKGGKSEELIPLAAIAKEKGAHILTITANKDSILAKESDVVLLLPSVPESDRYGVMSTASFAATVAIFDALMVGLMEEKDYPLSDFALIHPGGAVGKQICK
jgi:D-arabinose 5-phosphate isomerase GutQ